MQPRQQRPRIALEVLGRQVLGQDQLQPVQHLGCRGLLLQARRLADLEELGQGGGQEAFLDRGEMHADDGGERVGIGETDVVKEAAPQEGVGQFLLVVRGDDDDGAVLRPHGLAGFVDVELHPVQFLQQVVGKLDVGLVDLVDQQHHAARRFEGLPQLALADVVRHVMHPRIAQLAVAQPADGVVFVQPLLRLGGGLDVPFHQRQAQAGRHLAGQFGLAGAGFALDQQRPLQRHRRVHCNHKGRIGDITLGRGEFHRWINPLRSAAARP